MSVRHDCLGLSLFHKLHLNLTRPLVRTFMPDINHHLLNTRHKLEYRLFPYRNKLYSNSFFPYFTKKWIATPQFLRQEADMGVYKSQLKLQYKPTKYKFYSRSGNKRGASLMTQLRVGRSYLNDHSFPIGQSDTAACSCAAGPRESTRHMVLLCSNYTVQRQTLMGKVEQILSTFKNFTDTNKLEVLLFGMYPEKRDYFMINKSLQVAVQHYLIDTKRFDI